MQVGLAWLVRSDWRLLQVLYSAPALLFTFYWWLAPESVRWLVARGRAEEARALIARAARRNNRVVKEALLAGLEATVAQEQVRYTFSFDLMHGHRHRLFPEITVVIANNVGK